jgi:diguanylate cyclase (GGDEF)-like protein
MEGHATMRSGSSGQDAVNAGGPANGMRARVLEAMGTRGRDEPVGLLMLDIDDFKRMNTLYGHPGGDRVLVFIAACLRRSSRAGDLPTRLGGDEFAILVRGVDADGMAALAERVLAYVRAGEDVRASAGWVVGSGETEELLRDADDALAEAKRRGKDRALSGVSS